MQTTNATPKHPVDLADLAYRQQGLLALVVGTTDKGRTMRPASAAIERCGPGVPLSLAVRVSRVDRLAAEHAEMFGFHPWVESATLATRGTITTLTVVCHPGVPGNVATALATVAGLLGANVKRPDGGVTFEAIVKRAALSGKYPAALHSLHSRQRVWAYGPAGVPYTAGTAHTFPLGQAVLTVLVPALMGAIKAARGGRPTPVPSGLMARYIKLGAR